MREIYFSFAYIYVYTGPLEPILLMSVKNLLGTGSVQSTLLHRFNSKFRPLAMLHVST